MIKFLGLCGQAGHGKDALAKVLMEEAEKVPHIRILKVAYADELKRDLERDLGQKFPDLFSWEAQQRRNRHPFTRLMQQWYGELMRKTNPRYWIERVDNVIEQIEDLPEVITYVVFSDIRHFNEEDHVREKWGGIVAYSFRPGYSESGVNHEHESERHVKEIGDRAEIRVINSFENAEAYEDHVRAYIWPLLLNDALPYPEEEEEMPVWLL